MRGETPGNVLALAVVAGVSYSLPLSRQHEKRLEEFVAFSIANGRHVWVHRSTKTLHAHTLAFVDTPAIEVRHVRV